MRVTFGVLCLLIVVAVVGMLVRKQLGTMAPSAAPVSAGAPGGAIPTAAITPKEQMQQFQKALQGAMQQPRPMTEDQ